MKKITTVFLAGVLQLTGFLQVGAAQTLRIVNAASQAPGSVAPGSIVSIFGTKLSGVSASATTVQNPPTSLGGVSVSIGGVAAGLFYVSPTQINAYVSPATPAGAQTVSVMPAGLPAQSASATIDPNAAPGLFSFSGAGTRDGAILNAVTFLTGDFSATTGGLPTYLALFATGLNTSAAPTVTIGGASVAVAYYGPAPCCAGLQQINVIVPNTLAGAGRVPVVLTSATGQASNAVQVVLLPPQWQLEFPGDMANQTRSREIAGLAAVPGTSLVLSVDENDDVVRVIDVSARTVKQVIALPRGADPDGIAVNASGSMAVVAEAGRGKAALLDLATGKVTAEVTTGMGAAAVAIGGSLAVVLNQGAASATVVDLSAGKALATVPVGRGPKDVAVDAAVRWAYVTNEDDGSISVIDLQALTVARTIALGSSRRPEAIALVPNTTLAWVTLPAAGPNGQVMQVDLAAGTALATLPANPAGTGGSTDVVYYNSRLYFANQAGGSVSILPLNAVGQPAGAVTTVAVDLGARALAVDAKDKLLVVSNEGTGTLVLVDLATNTVVGRVNAVRTSSGDQDDHGDRGMAHNAPAISSVTPASGKAGTTIAISIAGTGLSGATGVIFVDIASLPGKGRGHGKGVEDNHADTAMTVTNIQVNSAGTQLLAALQIGSGAAAGPRLVKVVTQNGDSSSQASAANTFTVSK